MYDLKEECQNINNQIKPSEDFMRNLKNNVIEEIDRRKKRKNYFMKAMIAACSTLVFFTGCVFAGNIENFMSKMFSNVNKGIQVAIENNYIQNIDMNYVQNNGISVKADYILIDDNNLDIAFNIKTELEFDEIYFSEISIIDENGNTIYNVEEYLNAIIYDNARNVTDLVNVKDKRLSTEELMKVYTLHSNDYFYEESKKLYIIINKIGIEKDNVEKAIQGNWCFDINLDNDIFYKDSIGYLVEETDLLTDYNISLNSTELNIKLKFKEGIELIDSVNKREQIVIEDKDGKIYYYNDFKRFEDNELKINFPITKFDSNNTLKLKIYLENEVLIFNIKKSE